jgi:polyhydroxyalkanoate synthesis regulator protein
LLQIIGDQEANDGTPLFSNIFLEQLIRFYGNALQGLMSEYLEKSLQSFMQQQESLRKQMQNVMDVNPMNIMSQMAQKNMSLWESMMPNKGQEEQDENKSEEKKKGDE